MLETESILRQAAAFCPPDKKMGWHLPARWVEFALIINAAACLLFPAAAHFHAEEPAESAVRWTVAELGAPLRVYFPEALARFLFPGEALAHF